MSTRERWTVYPLLFMTLSIALKDKVTREVMTDRMEAKEIAVDRVFCKALWVNNPQGAPQMALATTPMGGVVNIRGQDGLGLVLGHADKLFGLMFTGPKGNILPGSVPFRSESPRASESEGDHPDDESPEPPEETRQSTETAGDRPEENK